MSTRRAATLVAATAAFLGVATDAGGAVRSTYTQVHPAIGRLDIESDGADAIVVTCVGGRVLVNGAAPDGGELFCSRVNYVVAKGGPGDNRIDLSAFAPANHGLSKGVSAAAGLSGGAGDDILLGPKHGYVSLNGGTGSDWLQGQGDTIDRYVFGPAAAPERDTVVEPSSPRCSPSYVEVDRDESTLWTLHWDSLDFRALGADDSLTADERAPLGILAAHRNRIVTSVRTGGVAIEAISGGAGHDSISGACFGLGQDGDDTLTGSDDGDLLLGGLGRDTLAGAAGEDRVDGGPGEDSVAGGDGADSLVGGPDDDKLAGGKGSDVYLFEERDGRQQETATESGTSGVDVLSLHFERHARVRVDLASRTTLVATAPGLRVFTGVGEARRFEGAIGGLGDDVLIGNERANHFWGGGGADVAVGGRGSDIYHPDSEVSLPYGAYAFSGYFDGPFSRGVQAGRPADPPGRRSLLKVHELPGGGFDTLDLAERPLFSGVEHRSDRHPPTAVVDLSAPSRLVNTDLHDAVSLRRAGGRFFEGVRGTAGPDLIVGNAANNVLDGRFGRDVVNGGKGNDLCLTGPRERDVFRGCERRRERIRTARR